MYRIVNREQLGPSTFLWEVAAPRVALAARPGHFLIVRIDQTGERIPLTIADMDPERGTVTVVVQAVGRTTRQMMTLPEGAEILDLVGPLGRPCDIARLGTVVLVGGGLGVAPVFPRLRAYKRCGNRTIAVVGFRTRHLMFWEERFRTWSDELVVATDDGSYGLKGLVTDGLTRVLEEHSDAAEVVVIGPLGMMRACAELTRPRQIATVASLNSIMVDGTGMCGSCRVTVGGVTRFACVDGPDFDAHQVDFEELKLRQRRFGREERESLERYESRFEPGGVPPQEANEPGVPGPGDRTTVMRESPSRATGAQSPIPEPLSLASVIAARQSRNVRTIAPTRVPMREQSPELRARNFCEVNIGFTLDQAVLEASRCLGCRNPHCVEGCPVGVDIPGFLLRLEQRDMRAAYEILKQANTLPAVCGRVCPQEIQCEATCTIRKKVQPVAIGRLERFVADFAIGRDWDRTHPTPVTGKRVAIVGSGPAGLACAGDLIKQGVEVTVYEALHVAGGVLRYGIPQFRLPGVVIDTEVDNLRRLGVTFQMNCIVGRLFTVPELMTRLKFDAVFIGTGAGAPRLMNIPGESLNGVFSANEFLTRVNLMGGNDRPIYETPVGMGRRVAVIGAGNTAMDAARIAVRLGAEEVTIVYRRTGNECPARAEELRHAEEEGVHLKWLAAPVRILGTDSGGVRGLECVEMELGEPDASGRARPVPKVGSTFILEVDTVISALGTNANPVLAQTTPGLRTDERGYIQIDPKTGMTSLPGVFAGGDIVTGSATVILAMGAGRKAASGILEYIGLADPRGASSTDAAARASSAA